MTTRHERDIRVQILLAQLRDGLLAEGIVPAMAAAPEVSSTITAATTELLDALLAWRVTGSRDDLEPVEVAFRATVRAWRRAGMLHRCCGISA